MEERLIMDLEAMVSCSSKRCPKRRMTWADSVVKKYVRKIDLSRRALYCRWLRVISPLKHAEAEDGGGEAFF